MGSNTVATPQPPTQSERRAQLAGAACVLAAALCFSTKAILIKLVYRDAPEADAITVLAARMAFALPFFLAATLWGMRRGGAGPKVGARDVAAVAALGILGYYAASYLDTAGLKYLSASTERVILFVYPTLVVLIGAVFLRERVRPAVAVALAATYGGVALAMGAGPGTARAAAGPVAAGGTGVPPGSLALGAALVFGAALTFAVFLVVGVPVLRRVGAMRFSAWSMAAAALVSVAHYAAVHGLGAGTLGRDGLALCLAMGLVATVLPAFLMAEGMRRVGAAPAAIIGSVGPVATIGLDHAVLGQVVTVPQALGTALVLVGVLAVSLGGRKGA
jgi:drug/metabolite transporter (DMT)-like permease